MSAEGRIVRGVPTGAWTSRHHRWEPISRWWAQGLPSIDPADAQQDLARRWLQRFGPAKIGDPQWWTGWNKTTTRHALANLAIEEVDLHGQPGIILQSCGGDDDFFADSVNPTATLLPALDPTPMGWKDRDWFLAIDPGHIYDRAGNIGPTPGGTARSSDRGAQPPTGRSSPRPSQTEEPRLTPPSTTRQPSSTHDSTARSSRPRCAHPSHTRSRPSSRSE